MKKLGLAVVSALALCVTVAVPALAQYAPTVQPTGGAPDPNVSGGGGGGTAFTGANISFGLALLAVLVIAGVVALLVGRRRAAATTE